MDLFLSFDGRINPAKYWGGTFVLMMVNVVILWVAVALFHQSIKTPSGAFLTVLLLFSVPMFWPGAALIVKRLNDRDRPVWLAGLFLGLPILNSIVSLVVSPGDPNSPNVGALLLRLAVSLVAGIVSIWGLIELGCLRGTPGDNRHGPNPLDPDYAEKHPARA